MTTLTVRNEGARVALRDGTIVVCCGNTLIRRMKLADLQEVHLFGDIPVTADARTLMARQGIDVLLFDRRNELLGRYLSSESAWSARRRAQYRCLADPTFQLALAKCFVEGKIRNQHRYLIQLRRSRDSKRLDTCAKATGETLKRVQDAEALDILRGMEGHAARMYFQGLSKAVTNDEFELPGRNYRPPTDPINACLSFGYAILQSKVTTAMWRAGLDPFLGALHEPGRGKPSGVLDLMEEFRPVVVDRMVLRLVNRRQLTAGDFVDPSVNIADVSKPPSDTEDEDREHDKDHPVHLGDTGRAIFFRELGRQWRQKYEWGNEEGQKRLDAIIEHQAHRLRECFEREVADYEAFSIR